MLLTHGWMEAITFLHLESQLSRGTNEQTRHYAPPQNHLGGSALLQFWSRVKCYWWEKPWRPTTLYNYKTSLHRKIFSTCLDRFSIFDSHEGTSYEWVLTSTHQTLDSNDRSYEWSAFSAWRDKTWPTVADIEEESQHTNLKVDICNIAYNTNFWWCSLNFLCSLIYLLQFR